MCYLNPYEQLPNCNLINDFNNYFIYEDKDSKIDTNLFANIFSLVESKLEKSDIASLQIDFNSFDPNQKNI
jgi:MoaA/NifB/PqqE/SkfB family radical SAM enzyme